jgi:membrane fusion protein (multidrug efflux system)
MELQRRDLRRSVIDPTKPRRRSLRRQALSWLAVVLAIAVILSGLAYYKYSQIQTAVEAAGSFPEPQESVEPVRVRRGEWTSTARAIGTVVALRQVELRNELAGTVVEVGFASGDVVEAGQVLVRFDTSEEAAALAAAEAEARLAGLTFQRRKKLRSGQTVSAQDLDTAREQFAAATARASALEAGINKKTITAPFKARVGLSNLQPGAYLDVGSEIAMLQGVDDDVYVDFALPQDSAVALRPGVPVKLEIPQLPGGAVQAKIIAIDSSVSESSRALRFRALASGLGALLRPGAFVDVVAMTGPPQGMLFVPVTAVRQSPFGEFVFLLAEDDGVLRARQRIVQTGPVQGDELAILDGLSEGDLIAGAGSFNLREGLKVQAEAAAAQGRETKSD